MIKLKNLLTEADSGGVKWTNFLFKGNSSKQDGFRATFVGPNGAKFGVDLGAKPLDYTSKADNKLLDTLWKDESTPYYFDDYGFTCGCFDFETMGRGNLDSSTLSKVSQMFAEILVDKFRQNNIQCVYFQSTGSIMKEIHAIIVPKIASKLGLQVKQIKTGWVTGKDIFK